MYVEWLLLSLLLLFVGRKSGRQGGGKFGGRGSGGGKREKLQTSD